MREDHLIIFSGRAHPKLAKDICQYLQKRQEKDCEIGLVDISYFADKEINLRVHTNVRGADVFIIQPTCPPVNENLMELLILIDCLKRASAERITAVIPYYGYARKDRKDEGRVPITAKLVADLLSTAGANRILTMDLHADQIQGFFDIPVDHMLARAVFIPYFRSLRIENLTVVSPDVGSVKQAQSYAKRLNGDLALVEKRRDPITGQISIFRLLGDVKDKNVLVVDDIISTGGTIVEACKKIKEQGARDIYIAATHGVLCGDAMEILGKCPAKEIVVTNTVVIPPEKVLPNMKILSIASYLAEAIRRIHNSESVSSLFDDEHLNGYLLDNP